MIRMRWFGPCLALFILAPLGSAQEDAPLAQVPGQAPIVFHLRGFERTKGRLVTLINNALPDLGKRFQESLEDTLKSELGERQFKGLAPFGPVFLVLTEMPRAEEPPPMAVVARVTDMKAFRAGFFTAQESKTLTKHPEGYESLKFRDDSAYILERGGYLVLALKKEALTPFLKPDKNLAGKLRGEAAKRLLAADAAVYVDTAEVYRVYGQTIRDARQFFDLAVQQGAGVDKDQIEMAKKMIDGALQGFEDSRGLVVTADFRPDGVALHANIQFGGDTTTNQFLKVLSPGDLTAVGTLPAGQLSYIAMKAEPALVKAFGPLLSGVWAESGSKQAEAIKKALELTEQSGLEMMLQTANLKTEGLVVTRSKDPAKSAQGQLQLFQALTAAESYSQMKLKKATVKPEAQKHRGFTLHHIELVWDFEKMMADNPLGGKEMADAMKKMMGEGLNVWFGTDGKLVVQASAKTWAEAQKSLDNFLDGKSPVGKDAAFQAARKELPAQANVLMLYDVPQLMESLRTMFTTMFRALGQGEVKVEPAKEQAKPFFLGVALLLKAESVAADVWIPAPTAREVQKLIEPLMQAFGG